MLPARGWLYLVLAGGAAACSTSAPSRPDGPGAPADAPGSGGQVGSGGAIALGGSPSDSPGAGGGSRPEVAAGTGGFGSGGTGGAAATDGRAGGSLGNGGSTLAPDAGTGGVSDDGGQGRDTGLADLGVAIEVARSEGGPALCGAQKGTLGGSATEESSLQRWALTGADCHKYILQNNNFADPTGSVQTLSFAGASFEVVGSTASCAQDCDGPAAFPSIYVGGNGAIANGTYATWDDSGLPKRISTITRVLTGFAWSGGATDGDVAPSFDIWFAKGAPPAGSYDDAISGSIMIWLVSPTRRPPPGVLVREVNLAGRAWDVWVGPHGAVALGTDDPARPIVSYVVRDGPLTSSTFDLQEFIVDAVHNAGSDMSAGHTSQGFSSSWYLTDVFAGFQIWTGADAAGLRCSKFSCEVK